MFVCVCVREILDIMMGNCSSKFFFGSENVISRTCVGTFLGEKLSERLSEWEIIGQVIR